MKKLFCTTFILTFLATGFCVSFAFAQTSTTSSSSDTTALIRQLQELVYSLQKQILELQTQLKTARGDIETVKTEIKELKLSRSVSLGSEGDDIRELQEFLKIDSEIYPEGLVTGFFGPATEAAIKRFQEKHNIESIGIVGPKTRAKIQELFTEGAGRSGKIPPGLLHAPGIQRKLGTTTEEAIILPLQSPTPTPAGTIPAIPAQPIGQTGTTTVPAIPAVSAILATTTATSTAPSPAPVPPPAPGTSPPAPPPAPTAQTTTPSPSPTPSPSTGTSTTTTTATTTSPTPVPSTSANTTAIGTLSVSKSDTVSTGNISIDTNVDLGAFSFQAQTESVEISSLRLKFVIPAAEDGTQIDEVTVVDPNGTVVAGPNNVGADETITFANVWTVPIGTQTYKVKGKVTSDFEDGDTVAISLTPSADIIARGTSSGSSITASPGSVVLTNTLTVQRITASPPPLPTAAIKLPAPTYIRGDWSFGWWDIRDNNLAQTVLFQYSSDSSVKATKFRVYKKSPSDTSFSLAAEFSGFDTTSCTGNASAIYSGEWYLKGPPWGSCQYWFMYRNKMSAASYSFGEYNYYVVAVDASGNEGYASPTVRFVFHQPVVITSPAASQITSLTPTFQWTRGSDWASNFQTQIALFDSLTAANPSWAPFFTTDTSKIYDGPALDPSKQYRVSVYGRSANPSQYIDSFALPSAVIDFRISTSSAMSMPLRNLAFILESLSKALLQLKQLLSQ